MTWKQLKQRWDRIVARVKWRWRFPDDDVEKIGGTENPLHAQVQKGAGA